MENITSGKSYTSADVVENNFDLSKGYELVEKKEIEGTPFDALNIEGEWRIVLGIFQVYQGLDTFEECVKMTKGINWGFLMNVVSAMTEAIKRVNQ